MVNSAFATLRNGAVFAVVVCASASALAQQPARPQTPAPAPAPVAPAPPGAPAATPDPAFEASRAAFEALPVADRRAIQDALVWTGHYLGVTEGNFGARTRGALIAFEKSANLNADGIVDAKEIALLLAAGKKARDAAKFAAVKEDLSGMRIGVPGSIMTQKAPGRTGARFASADGQVTLDTTAIPVAEIDLPALFDRLKTESPSRKVTYKLARPDWIVVSGESAGKRFYTRFARGADDKGQPVLRGYTVHVPAARADLERVVIAIANSFEPFPGAAAAQPTAVAAQPPVPGAPAASVPPAPVLRPVPSATLVSLGGGRYIGVPPKTCAQPTVSGREARLTKTDAESGLAMIEAPGAPAPPGLKIAPAADVAASAELVVVGLVAEADPARPLEAPKPALAVAAGASSGAPGASLSVAVGLQPGAAGAPAFDRQGRLVGLVAIATDAPRLVAGVAPLRTLPLVAAKDVLAFAGLPPAPAREGRQSAGEIAQAVKGALASLSCLR